MKLSFLEKQAALKNEFANCPSQEARYQKIMELGKRLPPFETNWKTPDHLVQGCQSLMYLKAQMQNNLVIFNATSDALMSAGLAALLIWVYSEETPEIILKIPPAFLEELGISGSLTPSRANGLAALYLKMRQEALKLLVASQNTI